MLGTSPLGLILGGRAYVFAAILAIIDQPILGYGSWTGWMMLDYFYSAVAMVGTDAEDLQLIMRTGGGRAGHSVFFQAWIENGILSAIALLIIFYWMLRQFLLLLQHGHRAMPWLVYLVTSFIWAFLFSPFGVEARLIIGLFLALHVLSTIGGANTRRSRI